MVVATLVARNAAEAKWRLRWSLAEFAFGGSLESGGPFFVGVFGRNLISLAMNMFPRLI
jgi:hypothetical protein